MDKAERQENDALAARLIAEQNFAAAVIGGAAATLLSAVAYGITVRTWPFSHGFAAAGIGIVIGASMQFLGRGISKKFAVVAALYTIAGCLLGNLFVKILNQAQATAASPFDVLANTRFPELAQWSFSGLNLIQLVFWFVAVFFAVFLVDRPLSRSERLAVGSFER